VGLFVYAIIAGSQLRMRRRLEREAPERLKLRMWGYPYLSWITLGGILVVVSSMLLVPDARSQLYLSILSLAVILATYVVVRYAQRAVARR
jgi:GABA permease